MRRGGRFASTLIAGGVLAVTVIVLAVFYAAQVGLRVLPPGAPSRPLPAGATRAPGADAVLPDILTGKALVRLRPDDAASLAQSSASPVVEEPAPAPVTETTPEPEVTATPTPEVIPSPTGTPESASGSDLGATPTPAPETTGDLGVVQGVAAGRLSRVRAAATAVPAFAEVADLVRSVEFVVPPRVPPDLAAYARVQVAPPPDALAPLAPIERWVLVDLPSPEHVVPVTNFDAPQAAPVGVSDAESRAVDDTRRALERLKDAGSFEAVEPVAVLRPDRIPDDRYFSSTGAQGRPYDDLWGLKRLQAPAAWEVTTGSDSVTVAVIDTGIDRAHRDLQGNLWENAGEVGTDASGRDRRSNGVDDDASGYVDDWQGWDFADDDNDPSDGIGHGTHLAGTIAARGNNATDVVGVNWTARLLPLKVFPHVSLETLSVDVAAALRYAADRGARVVNMSFGVYAHPLVLTDAITYAASRGVVLVASAGNDSLNLDAWFRSPVSEPAVIGVSAWTPYDRRAGFSNYGSKIELAAPGAGGWEFENSAILSLRATGTTLGTPVDEYVTASSGTSMAAPHVSGAVALLRAAHPDWTREQVRRHLGETADDVGLSGRDTEAGFGVVNVARALRGAALDIRIDCPAAPYGNIALELSPYDRVEVRGTAAGEGFRSYRVEIGDGLVPRQWTSLQEQQTPVTDGTLAVWNVGGQQPPYDSDRTFRLTVNPETPDRIQLLSGMVLFPMVSIVIDRGSERTSTPAVELTLWPEPSHREMRLRNRGGPWGPWEPVTETKAWTLLPGDGLKAVEAEFRRSVGAVPKLVSDEIALGAGPAPAPAPARCPSQPPRSPAPPENVAPSIFVPQSRWEVRVGEPLAIPITVRDEQGEAVELRAGPQTTRDFPGSVLGD